MIDMITGTMRKLQTSTVNGWFRPGDPTVRSAGEEVIVGNIAVATGATTTQASFPTGAIAPDGSAIGEIILIGVGLNVFGHICLMYGSAPAITGSL